MEPGGVPAQILECFSDYDASHGVPHEGKFVLPCDASQVLLEFLSQILSQHSDALASSALVYGAYKGGAVGDRLLKEALEGEKVPSVGLKPVHQHHNSAPLRHDNAPSACPVTQIYRLQKLRCRFPAEQLLQALNSKCRMAPVGFVVPMLGCSH